MKSKTTLGVAFGKHLNDDRDAGGEHSETTVDFPVPHQHKGD
jgi:hypothetical protein